jgi:transposase
MPLHRKERGSMQQFIGCDVHKKYSVFVSMDETGKAGRAVRVAHGNGELERYLKSLPAGAPVAVETTGHWYWLLDAIEAAGLEPHLAHALAAKRMMGGANKTDKLDAKGLATLLLNGTLPEVWVPSGGVRDLRGLLRSRLALRRMGTGLKNRISAALARYGLAQQFRGDLFGKGEPARACLTRSIAALPPQSRFATEQEWKLLDAVEERVEALLEQIGGSVGKLGWVRRLQTLPGVGEILGPTIYLEIGEVGRFPTPAHLAAYAGLVPRVHSSGGHTRLGRTRRECNRFLKWAFVEAAEAVVCHQESLSARHVVRLFRRIKNNTPERPNKAVVAVARHLAESAWHILRRNQDYREPQPTPGMIQRFHTVGRPL